MKFFNINNAPKIEECLFEAKPKQTGVGFVSLGQRIRGLLVNNRLDLSGVNTSDDYDVPPDIKDDDKVRYDESQDFLDKLDIADMEQTLSSKVQSDLEASVSEHIEKKSIEKKSVDSKTNRDEEPEGSVAGR